MIEAYAGQFSKNVSLSTTSFGNIVQLIVGGHENIY